jgi:hypothetical protein
VGWIGWPGASLFDMTAALVGTVEILVTRETYGRAERARIGAKGQGRTEKEASPRVRGFLGAGQFFRAAGCARPANGSGPHGPAMSTARSSTLVVDPVSGRSSLSSRVVLPAASIW